MFQTILKPEQKDSDAFRTIDEVVASRGFVCESHKVKTDDGYRLTVHRIVNPSLPPLAYRPPVLIQHGFTSNSIHWLIAASDGHLSKETTDNPTLASEELDVESSVLATEEKMTSNLGFALAKAGFDVWLGNFRGNRYALEHETLSPDDNFWDFSLDDFIEYDLPSTINYILATTEESSLGYIGHSQGSLTMFGLLASKPEFNQLVQPFIALAPVARITNMKTPTRYLIPLLYQITNNITGPCAKTELIKPLISGHIFESYLQKILHTFLFILGGFNWDQLDETRLNVYHSHPFGDFSFKNLNHFLQIYSNGQLQKFDYGREKNLVKYGTTTPPPYDLKKITCPSICLFHGRNDWFTSEEDLQFLRQELSVPVLEDYQVPVDNWNHLDFVFGKDCGKYVNTKIIDILSDLDQRRRS